MRSSFMVSIGAAVAAVIVATGCPSAPVEVSGPPPAVKEEHAHEGPHGGEVIELGRDEKYHAELVENDQTESVTIYILDGKLKEHAIGEPSIVVSLTSSGQTTVYELVAAETGQDAGSSRFVSTDKKLFTALDGHGDVTGKLRVTIDGVPYTGQIGQHHHH